jgi:arginine decarboxylase
MFLTKGVGTHTEKLNSFELALRDAKIAEYNIVRVSSIIPPFCKSVSLEEGKNKLAAGQIVFCVLSENATSEPKRLIGASIGVARPRDSSKYGYLSEYHCYGKTYKKAGDYAEDIAAEMLATTLGVDFDPDRSWDEKREIWKISGEIVETRHITQTAQGDLRGRWTTVIAAAILLP